MANVGCHRTLTFTWRNNMQLSGGCLCGSVRYECSTQPVIEGNCHCRDCQKSSGSAFAPTFFVPENSISRTAELNVERLLLAAPNVWSQSVADIRQHPFGPVQLAEISPSRSGLRIPRRGLPASNPALVALAFFWRKYCAIRKGGGASKTFSLRIRGDATLSITSSHLQPAPRTAPSAG